MTIISTTVDRNPSEVNIRVQNAVLGCNVKNNKMSSVQFQGKAFNITVIQVYAPISNAEEAEAAQVYEDLQDFRINTQKRHPFHYRGLECKVGSQERPGITENLALECEKEQGIG